MHPVVRVFGPDSVSVLETTRQRRPGCVLDDGAPFRPVPDPAPAAAFLEILVEQTNRPLGSISLSTDPPTAEDQLSRTRQVNR